MESPWCGSGGADEFARAAELIRAGEHIDAQLASGRLEFKNNGDRPRMAARVMGPNDTVTDWETKAVYDEDLNPRPALATWQAQLGIPLE